MEHEKKQFIVTAENQGERLDKAIAHVCEDVSRARIQEWIHDELVCVNGSARKGSYRVREGDVISFTIPVVAEYEEVKAESIPLDICYEDSDVLVINKSRGMVVHPGSGNASGTLVNALLAYCSEDLSGIGGVKRPGIVHRIDKDTSGLLMIAKNDVAHQSLSEQLKAHSVERKYIAFVQGRMMHPTGTINAPIGRDPVRRERMAIVKDGKRAITHFAVQEHLGEYTMITCTLETGRTHQIRVHMKYIGFPIVGDPVYGKKSPLICGQALHASVLGFTHPRTGKRMRFTQEVPSDMENLQAVLNQGEI